MITSMLCVEFGEILKQIDEDNSNTVYLIFEARFLHVQLFSVVSNPWYMHRLGKLSDHLQNWHPYSCQYTPRLGTIKYERLIYFLNLG